MQHELVNSIGNPPIAQECSCGLITQGPEAERVMQEHIDYELVASQMDS